MRPRQRQRRKRSEKLSVELLEPRQLLAVNVAPLSPPDAVEYLDPITEISFESESNDDLDRANPLVKNGSVAGALPSGDADVYAFDVIDNRVHVRLTVTVPGDDPVDVSMELFDKDGNLLLRSDGTADNPRGAEISTQLLSGRYFVRLSRTDSASSDGSYLLVSQIVRANEPDPRLGIPSDEPADAVVGDFNGDGLGDVAVFYKQSQAVSIYYQNPPEADAIGFYTEQRFSFDFTPKELIAGDLDNDGDADLVIRFEDQLVSHVKVYENAGNRFDEIFQVQAVSASLIDLDGDVQLKLLARSGNALTIYSNSGTWDFQPTGSIALTNQDKLLAFGHFNDDLRLDLATFDTSTSSVRFLLQQPDGGFQSHLVGVNVVRGFLPDLPGAFIPHSLFASDFNGDGRDDIATADQKGTLRLLISNAAGSYSLRDDVELYLEDSNRLLAGDFNGDGKADLAATFDSNGLGYVYLQNDSGWTSVLHLDDAHGSALIQQADLDGDGKATELVLLNPARDRFRAFRIDENGQEVSLGARATSAADPVDLVSGDFNGDDVLDLAIRFHESDQIVIRLGTGDNSFAEDLIYVLPFPISHLETGDFNGDGRDDLLVQDSISDRLHVWIREEDGSLTLSWSSDAASSDGQALSIADFNSDGRDDLAFAVRNSRSIQIYTGSADGRLQSYVTLESEVTPTILRTGDANNDDNADLFVFGQGKDVEVYTSLRSAQDASVSLALPFAVNSPGIDDATVADLNGDGFADLVVNRRSQSYAVLNDRGTSLNLVGTIKGFSFPSAVRTGDFNNDGIVDLVTGFVDLDYIRVALGNGDGTYREVRTRDLMGEVYGEGLGSLVVGDFNGDLLDDVAVIDPSSAKSDDVIVLYSQGTGDFGALEELKIGAEPQQAVMIDYNSDSFLDVGVVTPDSRSIYLFMGEGNGRFASRQMIDVGARPFAVTAGDFNGDNVIDLATLNIDSPSVSILFGNEDGTFRAPVLIDIPASGFESSQRIRAEDLNGDGRKDLILWGNGVAGVLFASIGGTFRSFEALPAGFDEAADFNGDGFIDYVLNYGREFVIQYGSADGFVSESTYVVEDFIRDIIVVDANNDNRLDLLSAVASSSVDEVAVFLQQPDGSFGLEIRSSLPVPAFELLHPRTGDFNGDGNLDVAFYNLVPPDPGFTFIAGPVVILFGDAQGNFEFVDYLAPKTKIATSGVTVGDLDGDGRDDIFLPTWYSSATVLLSAGDGDFVEPFGQLVVNERPSPFLKDFDGDQIADALIVDRKGQVLFRRGTGVGTFNPFVVVNPSNAAADAFVINVDGAMAIATASKDGSGVSLYVQNSQTEFDLVATIDTDRLPALIRTADLNADGLDDLVAFIESQGELVIYLQEPGGKFRLGNRIAVGLGVGDLDFADVDGTNGTDILVTNQFSGAVVVLRNLGNGTEFSIARYRTGEGYYGIRVDKVAGLPSASDVGNTSALAAVLASEESATSTVVGDFDGDGILDLIVSNYASHTLGFLRGVGNGGFLNPVILPSGVRPSMIAAGDVNGDGILDLAVLDDVGQQFAILAGLGDGSFQQIFQGAPGGVPTGMQLADADHDGILDLIVANRFGDLLTLLGDGNGRFEPYLPDDPQTALAVTDLDNDGVLDVIQANRDLDELRIRYSANDAEFIQDNADGLLSPQAVVTGDLNNDGMQDLVVANSGANNILVYLGSQAGVFSSPSVFAVGTNPTGLSLADVNDDGLLDVLVANTSSNDISVLLGTLMEDVNPGTEGPTWTLVNGRRIGAGTAPGDVQLSGDLTGDGIADLVVTSDSGSITLLPGLGNGFFDDNNARTIEIPLPPGMPQSPNAPPPVLADFDNDGLIDFVASQGDSIVFVSNLSQLFFSDPSNDRFRRITSGINNPIALVSADVTGDRIADLIVANRGDGTIRLLSGGVSGLSGEAEILLDGLEGITDIAVASNSQLDLLTVFVAREGDKNVFAFDLNVGRPGFELHLDLEDFGLEAPEVAQASHAAARGSAEVVASVSQAFRLLSTLTGLPGGSLLAGFAAQQFSDALGIEANETIESVSPDSFTAALRELAAGSAFAPQLDSILQQMEIAVDGLVRAVDELLQEPLARFNEAFGLNLTAAQVRDSVADVLLGAVPAPMQGIVQAGQSAVAKLIANHRTNSDEVAIAASLKQVTDQASADALTANMAAERDSQADSLESFDEVFTDGLEALLAAAVAPSLDDKPNAETNPILPPEADNENGYRYMFASLFAGTLIFILAHGFRGSLRSPRRGTEPV